MRPVVVLVLLSVASACLFVGSLFAGATSLQNESLFDTLIQLRIARGAVAYLAGSAMAVAGVIAQGLFRNPLASPDVIGTSAGATLAGKISLLLFQALLVRGQLDLWGFEPEMILPLGCLAGALLGLLLLLTIARSQPSAVVLLLSGFLLSNLFLSLGSFVTSLAQESWEVGRAVIAFALGSVAGTGLRQALMIAPIVLVGTCAALLWARPLDLLLSGEEEARMLGLDVARARRWCIVWTALLTAGAVAVGGNVGFVGLVVPHSLRRFVGVHHAWLLPAAALGGGLFLLACDVLTRVIPSRTEVPLGVITGLIGAPLFLWLLLRARKEGLYA